MDPLNDVDNIINQLRSDNSTRTLTVPAETKKIDLSDDNVGDYVYQKTASLVDAGVNAVNDMRHLMQGGADPKELAAFAQLINAVTKSIDTLNNINLQNKHEKNAIELKKMDIAGKKDIVSNLPAANNILIATRDEVMSRIFDKPKRDKLEILED
jgi:hypothetical protein